MAFNCILWNCFGALIAIFFLNARVFGTQDVYLYNTHDSPHRTPSSHVSLKLIENADSKHILSKRQTDSALVNQPVSGNDGHSIDLPNFNQTTNASQPLDNKLPPQESDNNSTIAKKVLSKNLGENGAGIRKKYTTPAPPVSPPAKSPNDDLIVATVPKNNDTETDEDEISISKFLDEAALAEINKTLEQHNITETKTDGHIYYNSTYTVDPAIGNQYWIDMEHDDNKNYVKINLLLSQSYRRAATVKLSFDFPFYGHLVRNITIATGGFLYTGEYVHSWLAATQYIAPLMANFDTSLSNSSFIKYFDNGTAFTVQWDRISLQDKPGEGEFTFQTTLLNNGDIIFVYKTIPGIIDKVLDNNHPVKVGLSDAYIIDHTIFYVRRKTIYEYHRLNFNKEDLKNWTVIYLTALPTCLVNKDCDSCLTKEIPNFECSWCPLINRCSNGLDRHRQDWLIKGCDRKQLTNATQCSQINAGSNFDHSDGHELYYGTKDNNHDPTDLNHQSNKLVNDTSLRDRFAINRTSNVSIPNNAGGNPAINNLASDRDAFSDTMQAPRISPSSRELDSDGGVKMGASGILIILFTIAFVAGLGIWVLYAYRNPHTTSGQILIKYRPSRWSWKRGEARYTAATIHM